MACLTTLFSVLRICLDALATGAAPGPDRSPLPLSPSLCSSDLRAASRRRARQACWLSLVISLCSKSAADTADARLPPARQFKTSWPSAPKRPLGASSFGLSRWRRSER